MVGPFMQGVLLMGIIYMYSKGLMSLINDYYRTEISRKLKSELKERKVDNLKLHNFDLNDMDQLVNMEIDKEQLLKGDGVINEEKYLNFQYFTDAINCYRLSGKHEFLNILFNYNYNYYKMHPLKNPICWLNENNGKYYSDITNNSIRNTINDT